MADTFNATKAKSFVLIIYLLIPELRTRGQAPSFPRVQKIYGAR